MLKNRTELSKFKDPISLIQGFTNQAGSIPSSKYRHTLEKYLVVLPDHHSKANIAIK